MAARRRLRAAALLAGACLLGAGVPPARAAGGEADVPVVSPFVRFLGFGDPLPVAMRRGLRAFEAGRFEEAAHLAAPIASGGPPAHAADDARYLRASALRALGRAAEAGRLLRALVDADEPGPYYVPALLDLVEAEERAGRHGEAAALWLRHLDRPLRERDARGDRVSELFHEFGTLRAPSPSLGRDEKRWLSKPEELAVVLEDRRERFGDRLAYRAGLALQRIGRHRESAEAFRLVGLTSPYWAWARYSLAQDLHALDDSRESLRTLRRLERYPVLTADEKRLRNRARLLRAAIAIETGEIEKGIVVAGSIPGDDPAAVQAKVLIAEALVAAGRPALAVVYDGEEGERGAAGVGPRLVAARGLALGSAYASLGDLAAAERVVRGAARRVRGSRIEEAAIARAVARLAESADRLVERRLARERAARVHLSRGMAEILAHDGPWSFAKMLRRIRATLGAGAHVRIARGRKAEPADVPAGDEIWLAFLRSSRRPVVEDALVRLRSAEASNDGEGVRRLRALVDGEIRSLLAERNAELGRLSLDLEIALADALTGQARTGASAR